MAGPPYPGFSEPTDGVVLSQTEPTAAYGTLRANGKVRVTEVGVTGLDAETLEGALRDLGSEVAVESGVIDFQAAQWPVPRLARPSADAVETYVKRFGRAWDAHVAERARAAKFREQGYHAVRESGLTGLFRLRSLDFVANDGQAVATVAISIAAQDGSRELPSESLRVKLSELVELWQEETEGGITGAGEIVSIETLDTDTKSGAWRVWDADEVDHKMAQPIYPATLEATLRVEFRYEAAEV